MMKKLGTILLLATISISVSISSTEAGWKKRGWYLKKPDSLCVMRKVTVVTASGKVVVRKIRVCS